MGTLPYGQGGNINIAPAKYGQSLRYILYKYLAFNSFLMKKIKNLCGPKWCSQRASSQGGGASDERNVMYPIHPF